MSKNKLHVCTYSTVRFTLRFVNLFVKISQVCATPRKFLSFFCCKVDRRLILNFAPNTAFARDSRGGTALHQLTVTYWDANITNIPNK